MSWNNVISSESILDDLKMRKWQEPENPLVTIPEELVTDCLIRYEFEGYYGVIASHKDHPAFDEVRRVLSTRGYIKIPEYACWNGDRVTKRFRFNGVQLEVHDTFYCAAAWAAKFSYNRTKVVDIPEG